MGNGILGVDEAGRGAFAGPLVVAGVILQDERQVKTKLAHVAVRDSKTLSEAQREAVFDAIRLLPLQYHTVCIEVPEINAHGIGWANTEGIRQVIMAMCPAEAIVDGYFPLKKIAVDGVSVRCQVKADATVLPVILAGIVAKVTRDRIMRQLHERFPEYGWEKNKGYGTKQHIQAIQQSGICIYHREQFIKK